MGGMPHEDYPPRLRMPQPTVSNPEAAQVALQTTRELMLRLTIDRALQLPTEVWELIGSFIPPMEDPYPNNWDFERYLTEPPGSHLLPKTDTMALMRDRTTEVRYVLWTIRSSGDPGRGISHCQVRKNYIAIYQDLEILRQSIKCWNLFLPITCFLEGLAHVIVQEFCDRGSLSNVLCSYGHALPERIVAQVAKQVMQGLAYLQCQVGQPEAARFHRSVIVKPTTVLVRSNGIVQLSLVTQGMREALDEISQRFDFPKKVYWSRERLANRSTAPFSDCMWSAGVTFAECVLGRYPIPGGWVMVMRAIMDVGVEAVEVPATASEDCRDFLRQCGSPPTEGPQAEELLQHEFLNTGACIIASLAAFLAGLPSPAPAEPG